MRNSRARRDFFVDDTLEAGIVLTGTEVKSIRQGMVQISEAFVRIDRGTPVMYHAHIAEYTFGTSSNHNPNRPRKLLLNKREIRKWRSNYHPPAHVFQEWPDKSGDWLVPREETVR